VYSVALIGREADPATLCTQSKTNVALAGERGTRVTLCTPLAAAVGGDGAREARERSAASGSAAGVAPYARDNSRPSRAEYSERTRRRRASGEGQAAISAPSTTMPPPIQIHETSGDTIARKVAGGGFCR
jgi:hypothetical protein